MSRPAPSQLSIGDIHLTHREAESLFKRNPTLKGRLVNNISPLDIRFQEALAAAHASNSVQGGGAFKFDSATKRPKRQCEPNTFSTLRWGTRITVSTTCYLCENHGHHALGAPEYESGKWICAECILYQKCMRRQLRQRTRHVLGLAYLKILPPGLNQRWGTRRPKMRHPPPPSFSNSALPLSPVRSHATNRDLLRPIHLCPSVPLPPVAANLDELELSTLPLQVAEPMLTNRSPRAGAAFPQAGTL